MRHDLSVGELLTCFLTNFCVDLINRVEDIFTPFTFRLRPWFRLFHPTDLLLPYAHFGARLCQLRREVKSRPKVEHK
jgi:hypothetical protein